MLTHKADLYPGKAVYLKRSAFYEMLGGVFFAMVAGFLFIGAVLSLFYLKVGPVIANSLSCVFFIYLAHNCFSTEIEYKYRILMYAQRKVDEEMARRW